MSWTCLYSPEKTTAATNCSLLVIVDDVLMFLQVLEMAEIGKDRHDELDGILGDVSS